MHDLIVTGFMGTGKSAVGRELARRLGRPLVDMDAEIEAIAGKPIPRIFSEDGEAAFRQMEAALLMRLQASSAGEPRVIATGGGTLLTDASRSGLADWSTVVCLNATPDEILRRLGAGAVAKRPMLCGDDARVAVEQLLEKRRPAYETILWQVETTGLPVKQVAQRVAAFAEVITLPVRSPAGHYPIHLGKGLLPYIGGVLRAAGVSPGGRVALVSNPVVMPLYGPVAEEALRASGLEPFACLVPDGEANKTLAAAASLYEQFLAGGLDRGGTVVALGGGVTGDVAGFAAATYLRGVRLVQVPTTLLAMVDASVGGKTGVDLPQGKNLVGAFKQPAAVLVDPAVLRTLPPEEVRSGMSEMIKTALIGDPGLFEELEQHGSAAGGWIGLDGPAVPKIAAAVRVKVEVVEADPLEQGQRAVLNLGHTVGHALEQLSGYSLKHGEAVAVGMAAATRAAVAMGRAPAELIPRLEAMLAGWGLPVRCPPFGVDAIWAALAHDKKRRGRSLRWVLPRAVGAVEIRDDVSPELVRKVLREMGA